MSHSWLDSVPNNPHKHQARRPTVVRESSEPALVTGQTRSCASPQMSPSPHDQVTQDYHNKAASKVARQTPLREVRQLELRIQQRTLQEPQPVVTATSFRAIPKPFNKDLPFD
ncbi:hypothetical protein MRX96_049336 [Rhipicephalus microplus]